MVSALRSKRVPRGFKSARAQFGLRVATKVQFGSRLRVLRAKVQRSVILVTWFSSPSTTLSSASRVTLICSVTNLTVTKAVLDCSSASMISASEMPTSVVSSLREASARALIALVKSS